MTQVLRHVRMYIGACATVWASHVEAQTPPIPDQIRTFYVTRSDVWAYTLPYLVVFTFVAAKEAAHFNKELWRSTITRTVAGWHSVDDCASLVKLIKVISDARSARNVAVYYVNETYLGHGCYGVARGKHAYFERDVAELDLHHIAYLAALPKTPLLLGSQRHAERALQSRNFVIEEMVKFGAVAQCKAEATKLRRLDTISPLGKCDPDKLRPRQ